VESALAFSLLVFAAFACAVVIPVLVRLYTRSRVEEITPEWLESFSTSTYLPMERLLNRDDFRFLKCQAGYDSSMVRRFRRERIRIFRQYLNRVVVDFNQLHLAARVLIANSAEDQSALLNHLVWLKLRFGAAVVQAECSYLLCRFGSSTISVRGLIARLEEMSAQLNALSMANAAA
jgi:hypothetical protein